MTLRSVCGVKQKDDLEELRASCVRASQGRSDLLTFYHHSVNKRSDHIRFIIKRQQSRKVYLMYHLSCEIESNLVCLKCASINKKLATISHQQIQCHRIYHNIVYIYTISWYKNMFYGYVTYPTIS